MAFAFRSLRLPAFALVAAIAVVALLARRDDDGTVAPEGETASSEAAPVAAAPSALAPSGRVQGPDARQSATATGSQRGAVAGRLRDAEGRPVAGARVVAGDGTEAVTDEDGAFVLEPAPPAPTPLVVETPWGRLHTTVGALAGGAPLVVPPTVPLAGTVVDAETGAPVAGILVAAAPSALADSERTLALPTGDDGSFSLDVAPGRPYVLRVGSAFRSGPLRPSDAYVPVRVDDVEPGAAPVVVKVTKGSSIAGRVEDDAGERVVGAVRLEAFARTASGDLDFTRRRALRFEGGEFHLAGLEPGRYDLHFRPEAGPVADGEGAAGAGDTIVRGVGAGVAGLVLRLVRGAFLAGRLVDEAGAPVLGFGRVTAVREEEPDANVALVGRVRGDGTFVVGPLDDGLRYRVTAEGFAGRRSARAEGVVVAAGGIELVLPAGRRIAGRVVDAAGRPLPAGVPVGFVAEGEGARREGTWAYTTTGADGTFVADGLLPGRYTGEAGGGTSGYVGEPVAGVEAGGEEVVLRVAEGVALAGRLVDEAGEPVAATVQADDGVRRAAKRPYVQVGTDGRFVFRGLAPGTVRFTVRRGEAWVEVGEARAPATDVRLVVPAR